MSFDAKIEKSEIFKEIITFRPSQGIDNRGSIFTSYDNKIYDKYLPKGHNFVHDKFSRSTHNVLRGLHGDSKTWKLVSCISGKIFQVVVDFRKESDTYLKWESWILDDQNNLQILIPPGFVNGHYVLSEQSIFHYKLSYKNEYFDVKDQIVVKWNDNKIGIKWPSQNPILNDRDS